VGALIAAGRLARIERALVLLIALHSAVIGVVAIVAAGPASRLAGFGDVRPLFFVRQVGVFHLVVAAAYWIEYVRYRGVTILLTTKTVAVVFLAATMIVGSLPPVVPLAAAGDAAMALAVVLAHRAVVHERAETA
jgi:hypothetical protein